MQKYPSAHASRHEAVWMNGGRAPRIFNAGRILHEVSGKFQAPIPLRLG